MGLLTIVLVLLLRLGDFELERVSLFEDDCTAQLYCFDKVFLL